MTAIEFFNVNKSYGKPKVLDGLCLKVRTGEIYGLLGQSGCGKTTAISALVNKILVDSGTIEIFGDKLAQKKFALFQKSRREIGYMPQEDGLYPPLFKIKELFIFFGRLYQMDERILEMRIIELQNILHLPNMDQFVQELSGGERRRVSVGLALIHRPQLVVLDEPSVGVDAVVRASIWEYFRYLVAVEGTTILLTTHYSEEGRLCDTVGYMGGGKLLFQGSPQSLMRAYNTDLMQDCILKLSKERMEIETETLTENSTPVPNKFLEIDDHILKQNPKDFIWHEIYTTYLLIDRNFLLMWRQKPIFLFCIIEQWMFVLMLTYIGRDPANLLFAVYNPEISHFPANQSILEICQGIENSGTYKNNSSCLPELLSCPFLLQLPPDRIILHRVMSEKEGISLIQKGAAIGLLKFPPNFTDQLTERFLLNKFATEEVINGSEINVRLDMTNKIVTGYILEEIPRGFLNFVKKLGQNCEFDTQSAEIPLKINAIYGSLKSGIGEYLQPVAPLWSTLVNTIIAALYYIFERKVGIVERIRIAGVSSTSDILSGMLTNILFALMLYLTVLPLLVLWHGWTLDCSLLSYSIIVLATGIVSTALGIFIVTVLDNEFSAILSMVGLFSLTLISSGIIWPIETTHPIIQIFANLLPLTLPLESGRLILSKGWSLLHPKVLPGLCYSLVLGILLTFSSIVISTFKKF